MNSMSTNSISVPLCDPKMQYLNMKEELNVIIGSVLHNGFYVMGMDVHKFEEEWAEYCSRRYCVAVSSGTDALYLTLTAMSLVGLYGMFEKQIITTPFTFWATTQAIIQAGMEPVFVDIDPITGNVGDHDFKDNPSLMVPLYGRPGQWKGENLIEDRAHAHGIPCDITNSKAECYSFYPTKNLGAMGQAGAVVTDNQELAEMIIRLREYGEGERFHYYAITGNHRMDEIQAAILRRKWPHLDEWNAKRRHHASQYLESLQVIKEFITLPPDHPNHVYHIFTILAGDRDNLSAWLQTQNIQTSVRYPVCCHQQPVYREIYPDEGIDGDFPNAERWAATNLSLPIYPEMTKDQRDYVIDRLIHYYLHGPGAKK